MVNSMDDSKIIDLFYERSEQAIIELSQKYGTVCTKVANNILNDVRDTEECVNDAYLGAWNTIPPQNPNPLLSYVCRIVRNLAIKRYHSNTAKKRNSIYDVALDGLDKESRVMFVRRYWYADSISDLAQLFHTSNHNVSVRLSRIRNKLKKHLIQEGVLL